MICILIKNGKCCFIKNERQNPVKTRSCLSFCCRPSAEAAGSMSCKVGGIESRILSMICQDSFPVVPGKKSCFVYRLSIRSGLVAAQLLNKLFQPFTSLHDILVAVCKGHPEHHPALRAAVRTRHTSGSRAARKRISCCIRRILTGRIC